jgi:rhodanese-related sulfurtransferase
MKHYLRHWTIESKSLSAGILLLLAVTLPLAGLNVLLNPHRPSVPGDKGSAYALNLAEIIRLNSPVLWVDARSLAAFERAHPVGAIHFPPDEPEHGLMAVLDHWQPGGKIVVYCDGALCGTSEEIATQLREEYGIESAYFLVGGWDTFQSADYAQLIAMEGGE